MASTAALARRLDEQDHLLKEVIKQCGIATQAYQENQEPFEKAVRTIREEIRARFDGLDERLMKLEGRK